MCHVPASPTGDVAVIWVLLLTVKLVARFDPNFTMFVPARFTPVIVTMVPPVVGPVFGDTAVIVKGTKLAVTATLPLQAPPQLESIMPVEGALATSLVL